MKVIASFMGFDLLGLLWEKRKLFFIVALGVFLLPKIASADGGLVWKEVTGGIPESAFRTVAADPFHGDCVYAGTTGSLYQTIDGGKSWKKVLSLHGESRAVHQIRILAQNDIWAATDNGLYHSSDGEIWERQFRGMGEKGKKVFSLV
ncbi:MAG: hypothetical protein ABH845_05020, partial [Candidatus Omnitrophota bacterium]